MEKELKMKDYPKKIRDRVKEIACGTYNKNFGLMYQFDWEESCEGADFWVEINDGNFDVFYEMYPKEENEKVLKEINRLNDDEYLQFDALDDIEVNEPEIVSDSIVDSVIESFKERSNVGIKKYGVTLDRDDLSFLEWINHLQTELQDAILYAEKLKSAKSMYYSFDMATIKSIEVNNNQLIITTK